MQAKVIAGTVTLRNKSGKDVTYKKDDTIPDVDLGNSAIKAAMKTGQIAVEAVVDLPGKPVLPPEEPEILADDIPVVEQPPTKPAKKGN